MKNSSWNSIPFFSGVSRRTGLAGLIGLSVLACVTLATRSTFGSDPVKTGAAESATDAAAKPAAAPAADPKTRTTQSETKENAMAATNPANNPASIPPPNLLMSGVPTSGYPKPAMVTRAEWGAAPGDASKMRTHTIKWVTIHHGGVVYDGKKDAKTMIKNLQTWGAKEKGWGDVPYHFEIDLAGKIYECRELKYAGDTNTEYDPMGHALVCLMGNYEEQVVSPAQLDAVVEISAWLCSEYKARPGRILGHKDWAETACPGKNFYPYVADGTIARMVAERLAAKGCLAAPK